MPLSATEAELPDVIGTMTACMLTMSSSEISELTGKRHDHVLRDGRKMLADLLNEGVPRTGETPETVGSISFEGTYRHPQNGATYPILNLPKRECIILVSGYHVGMRARIVDRWMELEAAVSAPRLPDLSDPSVLLRLLTEQAQGRIADQRRAVDAEAAAALSQGQLDRLASTKGSIALRDAGKSLGFAKCDDIFAELHARHWIFKRDPKGHWIGHQDKCRAGYLDHEPVTYRDRFGEERTRAQVVVTPKGLVRLAEIFAETLVAERPG